MKVLYSIFILVLMGACMKNKPAPIPESKKKFPSHVYKYVTVKASDTVYKETVYAYIYSDIYHRDGTMRYPLTNTVSIRNTSLTDSAYILSATYHDSYGKTLHEYVDSTILLSPLESIEYVVEETENKGGAGANFVIEWGAPRNNKQLKVQSIMIGTNMQQGISFITDGIVIK